MLASVGELPADLAYLRHTWEPWITDAHGALTYRSEDKSAELRRQDGAWCIVDAELPQLVYARANSEALHPHTVWPGEWVAQVRWPGEWRVLPAFRLAASLVTDAEHPVDLAHVGLDVFERWKLSKPIWFRLRGNVYHSAAKGKSGRRYCQRCDAVYSANNFVSQHYRLRHTGIACGRRRLLCTSLEAASHAPRGVRSTRLSCTMPSDADGAGRAAPAPRRARSLQPMNASDDACSAEGPPNAV